MSNHDPFRTPVFVKREEGFDWPTEPPVFYVLAQDGLFLCRNHEFFRSCTRARHFPGELEPMGESLLPRYPQVPRALFERIVGFFSRVAEAHGSEAGVHLVWDRQAERMEVLVPEQTATVSRGWNGVVHPVGLHYAIPDDLPAHKLVVGDVHSHVDSAAYASGTDVHDEAHSPGLHLVVGRISREPPDVHAEIVVDGARFRVDPLQLVEDYRRRDEDVPDAWMDAVTVEDVVDHERGWSGTSGWGGSWSAGAGGWPSHGSADDHAHSAHDGGWREIGEDDDGRGLADADDGARGAGGAS